MAGVALGGALTYLTQRTTQRAVHRAERQRHSAELTKERREEQIRTILDFIRSAYVAEGVAHARPDQWEVGDEWYMAARPAMDSLRIAEQGVELLCATSLHAPTTAYTRALNHAVWQEREGLNVVEQLEPLKADFLAVARHSLA